MTVNLFPDLNKLMTTYLPNCIDRLGSSEFYASFFQMMKSIANIDQYMVFEFSPTGDQTCCRLAHNMARPELGVELASISDKNTNSAVRLTPS